MASDFAFCDISTGEFRNIFFPLAPEDLLSELAHIAPREILIPDSEPPWLKSLLNANPRTLVTKVDSWKWEPQRCGEILRDGFGVLTLEAMEVSQSHGCVVVCGVLFDYLRETQRGLSCQQVEFPRYYDTVDYMKIDEWTAKNLELRSSTEGSFKHSLLGVMDETRSPMGARLLRRWMSYPLLCVEEIKKRQDAVAELLENLSAREDLMEALRQTGDLERLIHRIETPSARPRDIASLQRFLLPHRKTPRRDGEPSLRDSRLAS